MCADASFAETPAAGTAAARILDVAEALFAEKGYEGVSVSEIARSAGVSKANVFHHFGSKEGLYMAVLRAACRHSARALDAVEALSSKDPRTALSVFFVQQARMLFEHAQSSRLLQRELFENASVRGRRLAEDVFAVHFDRLVALIRQGQRAGQLRAHLDPALLAFLLIAANVFFFETRSVLRHLPGVEFAEDPEGYAREAFALLAGGFDHRSEGGS